MNFFVTGVGGQLGHDVMNELLKRGHEGVGSDIQETYSGVADGSAVTKAPYVALDGCVNNNPKKPRIIGNRISVLDRLHIKLEERKQKGQPQQQRQQERSRKN